MCKRLAEFLLKMLGDMDDFCYICHAFFNENDTNDTIITL